MFSNKDMWGFKSTRGETSGIIIRRFISSISNEAVTIKTKLITRTTAYEATLIASNILRTEKCTPSPITSECPGHYYTAGTYKDNQVLVFIENSKNFTDDDDDDYSIPSISTFSNGGNIINLLIVGPYNHISDLMKELQSSITRYDASVIRWWYKTSYSNSYSNREIFLEKPTTTLHGVLYPSLKDDPHVYLSKYLKSEAAILLLSGEPGTGKTTLLRHLIADFNLHADIIYDEEALKSDYVFHNFLFDSPSTILIVEDADTILLNREDEHNPLMARFLNVAAGLIRLPNKKLVFTTNLKNFQQVDPALIRPGRCFDVLRFRPYSYAEAVEICKFMNWEVPKIEREYTTAELATGKSNPEQHKIGYNR